MSKKGELIENIADWNGKKYLDPIKKATEVYDEIRASILTPKVVALMKAIGRKPEYHNDCLLSCNFCETVGSKYRCDIDLHTGSIPSRFFEECPLLSSEELKELTE